MFVDSSSEDNAARARRVNRRRAAVNGGSREVMVDGRWLCEMCRSQAVDRVVGALGGSSTPSFEASAIFALVLRDISTSLFHMRLVYLLLIAPHSQASADLNMADASTARVPAWKRLGLKLKFAQETTPAAQPVKAPSTTATSPSSQQQQHTPPTKVATSNPNKRDRNESSAPEASAKRAKSQSYERPVATRPIVAPEPYVPKRYGFAGISVEPAGKKTVFADEE